jgi:hypothetical protein
MQSESITLIKMSGTDSDCTDSTHTCAICETPGVTTRCSGCQSSWYCSYGCQKAGWQSGHKEECHEVQDADVVSCTGCTDTDPLSVPSDPLEEQYRNTLSAVLLGWIIQGEGDEAKATRMKDVYERCIHRPNWFTLNAQGRLVPAC